LSQAQPLPHADGAGFWGARGLAGSPDPSGSNRFKTVGIKKIDFYSTKEYDAILV
jgi:hypothetical protein